MHGNYSLWGDRDCHVSQQITLREMQSVNLITEQLPNNSFPYAVLLWFLTATWAAKYSGKLAPTRVGSISRGTVILALDVDVKQSPDRIQSHIY